MCAHHLGIEKLNILPGQFFNSRKTQFMCAHHLGIEKLNILPGQFFNSRKTQFMCAHHLGKFNFDDGECTDGPPFGTCLDSIPIDIKDGTAYVADFEK